MVASFSIKKDYKTFLEAATIILERRDDVTFLAIGEGDYLNYYEEMGASKYTRYIKFLGLQNPIEPIINIFTIGVLCTSTQVHREGISNSIMEYMALSKPVIATSGGGTNEIVINNVTGCLINQNNVKELVERIEFLVDHKKIAKNMGESGRKRILEKFNIKKMTDTYLELYKKCLN
jgi:glycosyltransferase involved in cell wall biosynthesis